MSQENVETLRRVYAAWNSDDFDTWIDACDPEVEWIALMEVFRGRAGAQQAWQTFKEAMGLTVRFDDFRDAGDRVLGLGQLTGTGRTTGLEVGGEIAQLATFRDGKVVRMEDFSTHAEGLRAAGLSE